MAAVHVTISQVNHDADGCFELVEAELVPAVGEFTHNRTGRLGAGRSVWVRR